MSGLCSHPRSTRFTNSCLSESQNIDERSSAEHARANYHDARDFRLFAESFIYGIRTIHTDIQTRIPFYTSMWGSLRLAPITM